jgi:hypothetical protein
MLVNTKLFFSNSRLRGKEKIMQKMSACRLVGIAICIMLLSSASVWAASPPKEGAVLPEIDLLVPKDVVHQTYLGLFGEGLFQIQQIKAKVVIIEIFNMY